MSIEENEEHHNKNVHDKKIIEAFSMGDIFLLRSLYVVETTRNLWYRFYLCSNDGYKATVIGQ